MHQCHSCSLLLPLIPITHLQLQWMVKRHIYIVPFMTSACPNLFTVNEAFVWSGTVVVMLKLNFNLKKTLMSHRQQCDYHQIICFKFVVEESILAKPPKFLLHFKIPGWLGPPNLHLFNMWPFLFPTTDILPRFMPSLGAFKPKATLSKVTFSIVIAKVVRVAGPLWRNSLR